MSLEEFSNMLYESKILHDYKDGKIDYKKVHNWIVSQDKQLILSGVVKSFTAEQVVNELKENETLDDAISFFNIQE